MKWLFDFFKNRISLEHLNEILQFCDTLYGGEIKSDLHLQKFLYDFFHFTIPYQLDLESRPINGALTIIEI